MPEWSWEVAERDHELQNPTSPEKILLLGRYLRLDESSRVLDVACGMAGPAILLAREYGCRVTGVELRPIFAEEGRVRAAAAGVQHLVEIRTGDAAQLELGGERFDAALCLGASFVWGTIGDAAAALRPAIRPGGFVAVGEPYWRQSPLPEGVGDLGYVTLPETVDRLERTGFALTGMIAASEDDWDRYESLHWRALEERLAERPDAELREEHERRRREYLAVQRGLLGWAILVGRKSRLLH